jgi:hypothetical protein
MISLYVLALICCVVLDLRTGIRRPLLIASFPLLFLDCFANLLCGQSWRNTMSGEAWHHREHRWWKWTHRVIDAMFFWQGPGHCQRQALKEAAYGSFWAALAADWRGELKGRA